MRNSLLLNNINNTSLLKPFLLSLQFICLFLLYFLYNTSLYVVFELFFIYFFNYFFFRFIFLLVNKKNDIYFAIFFLMISIFGYFGYFGLIPLEDIWLMSCFLVLVSLIWLFLFDYIQHGNYLIINDVLIYQVSFYNFFRKYKIYINKLYIVNYFSFYLVFNSVLLLNKFFNIYLLNILHLFNKSYNFNNYLVIYQYLYYSYSEKLFLRNQLKLELYKYNKLFLQNLNNNLLLLDLQDFKFLNQDFFPLNNNFIDVSVLKNLNFDLVHNLSISVLNNNSFFLFVDFLNNIFLKLVDFSLDLNSYNKVYKNLILKIQTKLSFDENILVLLNFFDILFNKFNLLNLLNIKYINFFSLISSLISEKLNTFIYFVELNDILLLGNGLSFNDEISFDLLNEDDELSLENNLLIDYFDFNNDITNPSSEELYEDIQDFYMDINSDEFIENSNQFIVEDFSLFFINTNLFNYNNGFVNLDYFYNFYFLNGYFLIFKYLLSSHDDDCLSDLLNYILYSYIFDNINNND